MEILLVDDVTGVGDIGETVKVRPGFARNYLIPKGLAVEVKTGSTNALAHKMKQIMAKKKRLKAEAEKKADEWRQIVVEVSLRVGSGGKVFGSINTKDIAEALKSSKSIEIDRRRIILTDPIKKLGRFPVSVKLHADVTSQFTVEVVKTEATKEEESKAAEQARIQIEKAEAKKKESLEDTESAES